MQVTIPYTPRDYQRAIHAGMESRRFSVVVLHRRAGKTVLFVNSLIKSALTCPMPRPRVAYIAPLLIQARQIAWDYLVHYTHPIPGVRVNRADSYIELPNGARVHIFGADDPDRLRGLYFDACVLDEYGSMKPEVWGEVVRPALADRRGSCVFGGTPRGMNDFWHRYQFAVAHPEEWYSILLRAQDTGVLTESELLAARSTMSDSQYRQEFECDFGASSDDSLIPLDIIQPALGKHLNGDVYCHAPVIMGVDVARFGDDKSEIYLRQGLHAKHLLTTQGRDTVQLAGMVATQIERTMPDQVYIDVGYNPGVYDLLRQQGHRNVQAVDFGGSPAEPHRYRNRRAEMWARMRDWLVGGGAVPDDQVLAAQLSSPSYEYDEAHRMKLESKKHMKERGIPSPDRADALALTFAGTVRAGDKDVARISPRASQKAKGDYDVLAY